MSASTQHYLINMTDGRVILFTKQAVRQINYHPISEAVAMAIGEGRISAKDVISRIKANLINNQDAWDDLLKKKTTMNTRKSTLAAEDSEGTETAPDNEDVAEEFDIGEESAGLDNPGADELKPDTGKKSGRGGRGKKNAPPADASVTDDSEAGANSDGDDLGDDI